MTKIMISLSVNKTTAIQELENLMQRASDSYYNSGKFLRLDVSREYPAAYELLSDVFEMPKGIMKIDDDTYDEFTVELKLLKPNSKVLKQVGAKVKTGKGKPPKVKLKHYMGSLDKIKPDTSAQWLTQNEGPYVVGNKEDGASLQLNYVPGEPPKAYTRGDGLVGQDVSHLVEHMNIPQRLNMTLDVRAEVIMPEAVFKAKWSKEIIGDKDGFENARNMVSGMVNRKDVHRAIKDVHIVVYDVLSPRGKPSEQLALLERLGFNVVPYKVYRSLTASKLSEILKIRKAKTKRAIDGLVIVQDRKVPLSAGTNPDHAVAYKERGEEDVVSAKVVQVIWKESRHNNLKPRIEIEPVRLAGVTVTYATGHNAWFVEHGYRYKDRKNNLPIMPIGPGAIVRIIRSGDVIPHIISIEKAARKPQMPVVPYVYGANNVEIKQDHKTNLHAVKRIAFFFTKIGVDGLKQGIVQKLYDDGLDNIFKVIRAKKERFLKIEGIQEKTAAKLRGNIDGALAKVTLPCLMEASARFNQGMGERRLVPLIKAYPNIMEGVYTEKQLFEMAMNIEGFSDILSKQFAENFPKFKAFYDKLGVRAKLPEKKQVTGKAFAGQTIVFTGFRNAAWVELVEAQGGIIGSGVNSKTSLLIFKDRAKSWSKIDKAQKVGVRTMSLPEFADLIEKL